MNINIDQQEQTSVVHISGNLDKENFMKTSQELKNYFSNHHDIVLDFKDCIFTSIEGAFMLFSLINDSEGYDIELKIENLSTKFMELIHITGFEGIFKDNLSRKIAADIFMHEGDFYTHKINNMKVRMGKPLPFGATLSHSGVNFSIFSQYATKCELLLFGKGEDAPYAVIPFLEEFRVGKVFTMFVLNVDIANTEYGYRMDGPYDVSQGHLFNKEKILLDPYAKGMGGRGTWGIPLSEPFKYRSSILYDAFDWGQDVSLNIPMNDLIIYETHVRGFTKHDSSNVRHKGTYAGIVEKIPYLKELGVNCVELLPIFEFDEMENSREFNGERLYNYWGYSTTCFFAPKSSYAATGVIGFEVNELKTLIRELHRNKIEVILDVVFNHTAEGNENGPYISYRGIDNKTYYLLTKDGYYYNFSGCGNTFNCNNAIVRNSILDCLRYWVAEYHIDGFRFDLASILSRDENGAPLANPPLIESLANDSILSSCKLIAEAWDAGGLYQVGSFPSGNRFAEWNGKYRDTVRNFLRSDVKAASDIKSRIEGSPDLYYFRTSNASINFITCHDGFTMYDMTSYNDKHNEANGENNKDGCNDNSSWNCGVEGITQDANINYLRKKQIKNAVSILLMSRGIPMLLSGDEFCNTQFGNNNAYCQDNQLSWLNWNNLKDNSDIFNYFKEMIAFRKKHPVLRESGYTTGNFGTSYPELSWHSVKAWQYINDSLCSAVMFCENKTKYGLNDNSLIYMAMNMHWDIHGFTLPALTSEFSNKTWRLISNTAVENGIYTQDNAPLLENQNEILVEGRSIIILIA